MVKRINITRKLKKDLEVVRDMILSYPEKFNMGDFVSETDRYFDACFNNGMGRIRLTPKMCGTTACIAGHYIIQTIPKAKWPMIGNLADPLAKALGLRPNSSTYDSIILSDNWPEPFREAYGNTDDKFVRAGIAAARIQYLINEGR